MNINKITEMLNAKGIDAESKEVNGKEAIIAGNDKVRVCAYMYKMQGLTDEQIVNSIIKAYENRPDIDHEFLSKENILNNVRLGIEKESDSNYLTAKTWMEGIQQYMYIKVYSKDDIVGNTRITRDICTTLDIDEDEIWKIASINTCKDTEITEFMGMAIITNKSRHLGAASLLDTHSLKKLANELNQKKLVIIPSSIHECILAPEEIDLEELDEMIRYANEEEVEPSEQLADRHFVFEV